LNKTRGPRCKSLEFNRIMNYFYIIKPVDQVHRSGGPRAGGGSRVHGGPRVAAAERLTRARARGRSGEWKLAGGGGK
jgi:hypothetical protein